MTLVKVIAATCVSMMLSTVTQAAPLLYKASGVTDTGGAVDTGVASAIHCSNPSSQPVMVGVRIRRPNGTVAGRGSYEILKNETRTFVTRVTSHVSFDVNLNIAPIEQGVAEVYSRSRHIFCTVIVHSAGGTPVPDFMSSLHMVRTFGGEE